MPSAIYVGTDYSTRDNYGQFLTMENFELYSADTLDEMKINLKENSSQLIILDYSTNTNKVFAYAMGLLKVFPHSRFIVFGKSLPDSVKLDISKSSKGYIIPLSRPFSANEFMTAVKEVKLRDKQSADFFDKEDIEPSFDDLKSFRKIPDRSLKTIICDDSKTARSLYEIKFRKSNILKKCDIIPASGGNEAMEIIRKTEDLQLLVTDYWMEDCSGTELTRKIREENTQLPIFMVTSFNDKKHKQEASRAGATEYFIKPMNVPTMESRVINHLLPIWYSTLQEESKY